MKKFAVAAALLSAVVAVPAMAADGGEIRAEVRGGYVTGSGLDDATLGAAVGYDFDLGSTTFAGAEIAGDKVLKKDRKSGVEGKSVSVRVDLGCRRNIKKNKKITSSQNRTLYK